MHTGGYDRQAREGGEHAVWSQRLDLASRLEHETKYDPTISREAYRKPATDLGCNAVYWTRLTNGHTIHRVLDRQSQGLLRIELHGFTGTASHEMDVQAVWEAHGRMASEPY